MDLYSFFTRDAPVYMQYVAFWFGLVGGMSIGYATGCRLSSTYVAYLQRRYDEKKKAKEDAEERLRREKLYDGLIDEHFYFSSKDDSSRKFCAQCLKEGHRTPVAVSVDRRTDEINSITCMKCGKQRMMQKYSLSELRKRNMESG